MSICPKNKSSKARRDKRRANWKMSAMNLGKVQQVRRSDDASTESAVRLCGSYNKKEIVSGEGLIRNGFERSQASNRLAPFSCFVLCEENHIDL